MVKSACYIEGIEKGGTSPDAKPVSVILRVEYGQKQARIELPAGEPLFDQEPANEVYRRALSELLQALQEVATSSQGVQWPHRYQK